MSNLLILITFVFTISCNYQINTSNNIEPERAKPEMLNRSDSFWNYKINEASTYASTHKMNGDLIILVDLGLHSGCKRLALVEHGLIIKKTLVSHGCGDATWGSDESAAQPKISNTNNSHCSSIGHYKIGARGKSEWGIYVNYLMHGLDATNSNALKRAIVLHGWDKVSDTKTYPVGTPEGWGCPAVSNATMTLLDSKLKDKKNVLLWVYTE